MGFDVEKWFQFGSRQDALTLRHRATKRTVAKNGHDSLVRCRHREGIIIPVNKISFGANITVESVRVLNEALFSRILFDTYQGHLTHSEIMTLSIRYLEM